jgi:cytidylate kinase
MIVTLDGPAGTGKSTVARRVAEAVGYDFLDTGAMYRAIGLEALRRECDLDDARELAWVAGLCRLDFDWQQQPPALMLNGEDVTGRLRGAEPTRAASFVAAVAAVREKLVAEQQRIGREHPQLVTEGRDQGSVVFPSAELKFFLDADPAERAQRRADQLRARGEVVDVDAIRRDMEERDHRDRNREVAPLKPAEGAEVIDTTSLTLDEVTDLIVNKVRARR